MTKSMIAAFAVSTNVSTAKSMLTSDTVHYQAGGGGEGLCITANMNITAGTGTTALVVVCKQNVGAGAGSNIGPASQTVPLAAGATGQFTFMFQDTAPQQDALPATPSGAQGIAQNQYVITVAQTGGTGAGSMAYGTLTVEPVAAGW